MEKSELHLLLHPYFDGELDFSQSLAFEEHLLQCPDCTQALTEQKKLREVLSQRSLRYTAPNDLQRAIQTSVNPKRISSKTTIQWSWKIYGIAASIAIGFLILWTAIPKESPGSEELVKSEIVSSHIRSLMASHLFDVASSDQHTVKPWFAGKLDFSPVVKDFTEQGFQLIGGRLDYIGGKMVAALVYQHQKHIINVFEWDASADATEKRSIAHDKGFNLISDRSGKMKVYLISDLNAEELGKLADLIL